MALITVLAAQSESPGSASGSASNANSSISSSARLSPCAVQTANTGHHLAGGDSGWSPELRGPNRKCGTLGGSVEAFRTGHHAKQGKGAKTRPPDGRGYSCSEPLDMGRQLAERRLESKPQIRDTSKRAATAAGVPNWRFGPRTPRAGLSRGLLPSARPDDSAMASLACRQHRKRLASV